MLCDISNEQSREQLLPAATTQVSVKKTRLKRFFIIISEFISFHRLCPVSARWAQALMIVIMMILLQLTIALAIVPHFHQVVSGLLPPAAPYYSYIIILLIRCYSSSSSYYYYIIIILYYLLLIIILIIILITYYYSYIITLLLHCYSYSMILNYYYYRYYYYWLCIIRTSHSCRLVTYQMSNRASSYYPQLRHRCLSEQHFISFR